MEETEKEVLSTPLAAGDPYANKTPHSMLTRQYLIQTMSFSNTSTRYRIRPHTLLYNIPTIKQYLSKFRYLRAGIKLRILMVSTQMQYGTFAVSYLPYTKSTTEWTSVKQRSQSNMHLMDISQQESLEIVLPYLSPKLYWDTQNFDDPGWSIDFSPLALGTVTSSANSSIIVKVFASFVEPECAGFLPEPVAQFQGDIVPATNRYSRLPHMMTLAGTAAGTVGTLATLGSNWMSSFFQNSNLASSINNGATAAKTLNNIYSAAKTFETLRKPQTRQQVEEPAKPAKLELCADLSCPSGGTSLSMLGDSAPKYFSCLPDIHNLYDVNQICQIPTYHSLLTINNTSPHDISCSPFLDGSYAKYFRPMFKYMRGSTRVFIRFATSPLVSGRIKVTLFPVSPAGANTQTEGDLPSWIITVRGPTSWALEVPYLQVTPWVDPTDSTVSFPTLRVQLLDNLPQPFDKAVSIFASVFIGGGQDLQFAGLQSFVPRTVVASPSATKQPNKAVFQCSVVGEMTSVLERIGTTFDFPYQGGLMNIGDIMSRYSSREAEPKFLFPFPIKIEDWEMAYDLDNYDYVANLYKFYTGDNNVRMLFSKGSASSLLRAGVSNSNTSTLGKEWKCGNSMAVTDQTVWPMLEFRYPYLNTQEFDSIWEPNGMFAQQVDNTAELDTYFISASDSFRLLYLLPVPDFFLTVPSEEEVQVQEPEPAPEDDKAFFQSWVPRFVGGVIHSGRLTVTGNTSSILQVIPDFDYDQTFCVELEVDLERTAGTLDFVANVGLTRQLTHVPTPNLSGNNNQTWPLAFIGGTMTWKDQEGTGKHTVSRKYSGAFSKILGGGVGPMHISMAINTGSTPQAAAINWKVRISPWKSFVALSSPQISYDTAGWVNANIHSTDVTLSVDVANNPTVVVDGTVDVQGSLNPTTPVWTTLYKP